MVTEKFNGVHGTYIADQTCYEWWTDQSYGPRWIHREERNRSLDSRPITLEDLL